MFFLFAFCSSYKNVPNILRNGVAHFKRGALVGLAMKINGVRFSHL
jgi:hypothetical protein